MINVILDLPHPKKKIAITIIFGTVQTTYRATNQAGVGRSPPSEVCIQPCDANFADPEIIEWVLAVCL